MNKPDKPGYYWARPDFGWNWWPIIVEVTGEAPYLRINVVQSKIIRGSSVLDFDCLDYQEIPSPEAQ